MASRPSARRKALLSLATFTWRPLVAEVQRAGAGRILAPEDAPPRPVALVLGAPVPGGRVSAVLEDRLLTAAALHRARRAERLLLSGNPDEVDVMAAQLERLGLGPEALLRDPRGRHTFESVRNAQAAGHRELLVVSQAFHLPRALYLASRLGLEAHGVSADRRPYLHQRRFEQRERISCVLAYWMSR